MIVVDTSVVLAAMDRRDEQHERTAAWLAHEHRPLVTSPLAVAEMDHLVARRGGPAATAALWSDLDRGAWRVEWWPGALRSTVATAQAYAKLGLGLTDASLIALAQRLATVDVATFDQRHFRAATPLDGSDAFRLLPLDLE